jgi:hypothetical protein
MCEARQYPLSFAEGDKVKQWSRSMWRLRPTGRRANIPVEIANPVGLARFGTGMRRDWFKGWLHMTTQGIPTNLIRPRPNSPISSASPKWDFKGEILRPHASAAFSEWPAIRTE